jgi:hypothetical protein
MKKLITLLFIFSLSFTEARSQSIPCPCMNPPCSFWDWLGGVAESVGGAILDAAESVVDAMEDVAHAVTSIFNDGAETPDGEGFDEPNDGMGWNDTGRWWEPPMNANEFYNPFDDPNNWPADFETDEMIIARLMDELYAEYIQQGWATYDCQGVMGGNAFIDDCGQCVPNYDLACQPYQLTAEDQAIWAQIEQEDQQVFNPPPTPCGPTLAVGQYWWPGTFEHWLIQIDFMATHPGAQMEYGIPNSGAGNGFGRADLANPTNGQIYEIKPDNPSGLVAGQADVARKVAAAIVSCVTAPGVTWHPATGYTTKLIPTANPLYDLEVREMAPGVLGYRYKARTTPLPLVIPQDALKQIRDLVRQLKNAGNRAKEVITKFLKDHPELVTFIKTTAITAAITIIVGTIIEDIYTVGVGIADDAASFALAWKIIRFAQRM